MKESKKEKIKKEVKKKYHETNKKAFTIYVVLRTLIIISGIIQIFLGNIGNVLMCFLALFLFTIPTFISEKYKIGIPGMLEGLIYLFIFSAAILGEINNFYRVIPLWDTILHTINGFICAGIGFSLIDLLNQNSDYFNISPLYVAIVAFCFSMTVGILWEFFEFSYDSVMKSDMQKDRIVSTISSVKLNEKGENEAVVLKNIKKTEIVTDEGTTTIEKGYLDIGLRDTMKDLFVNMIGAIAFSVIGFLYIINRDKYQFAKNFLLRRKKTT